MMGKETLVLHTSLMSETHWSCEVRSFALCGPFLVTARSDYLGNLQVVREGHTYQSDHLDTALLKLALELCEGPKLCRAYWSEVCGVRE